MSSRKWFHRLEPHCRVFNRYFGGVCHCGGVKKHRNWLHVAIQAKIFTISGHDIARQVAKGAPPWPPVELAASSVPVSVTQGLASPAPAHHHPPDPQCRPVVQDAPLAGARSRAARSRSTTWQENRRSWTGEGTRSRLNDRRDNTRMHEEQHRSGSHLKI